MKLKFKGMFNRQDRDEKRRKQLAAQAMDEIRRLADAKYPFAMLFEKNAKMERQIGESWPEAYARTLNLDLAHLRAFAAGIIETGLWTDLSKPSPTPKEMLNCFRGWAALLLTIDQELEHAGRRQAL